MITKHVSNMENTLQEILDSLTPPEIDKLRDECASLGLQGWLKWFLNHQEEIRALCVLPPSRRKARLDRTEESAHLVLGVYRFLKGASVFLEWMEYADMFSGRPYREISENLGFAYQKLRYGDRASDWPPEWGLDPFFG